MSEIMERGDLARITESGQLRPFRPTDFDGELLETADAAVRTCIPTAFVLPVPGTRTSALLAAAMLVAHFVQTGKLTAQIALVTKQLQLRTFYDTLFCRRERLAYYFPPTLITPDGSISDIGAGRREDHDRPARLHFVPDLSRLRMARLQLDGVVIESQAADESEVRRFLAIFGGEFPLLYLTIDPQDPVLLDFEERGAVWAWDGEAILSLLDGPNTDAVCADPDLLRFAAETSYIIVGPNDESELDCSLARLWDDLVHLQEHPGAVTFEAVAWAWGLFGALTQLVTPVEIYDRFARGAWGTTALSEGPKKAEVFARNTLRTEDREYWEILATDLEDAVQAALQGNMKPEALANWVISCTNADEEGLIVVRNRAAKKATEAYLHARADVPLSWHRRIDVITCQDLLLGRVVRPVMRMLWSGPVSRRYGGLLALPSGKEVTILAHGPWEAGRAVRQIQGIHDRLVALAHGPTHRNAVRRLFGDNSEVEPLEPQPLRLVHSALAEAKAPPSARAAVWNPFDISIARSTEAWEEEIEAPVETPQADVAGLTEAICVEFDDGIGFFEPGQIVSRVLEGNVEKVAAKALRPGDRVVLVDRSARRDLFDVIVGKLEQLPEFAAMVMLIQEWHERAARAYRSGLTQYEILRRMGPDAGVTTAAAVGFWLRGFVEGPNDPEDIRRFGEAVGDEFLTRHWRTIGQALATMRTHRRRLGRMLARVLEGVNPEQLEYAGFFDRRLGIHYSDLTDAVTVHIVVRVSDTPVPVLYHYVNRLLNDEEARRITDYLEVE